MRKIKQFELVSLLSGFFMFACIVIFGFIASGNQHKPAIKISKSADLSKKIEATPDSSRNLH
ncbi:hypothetical protein BKI52_37720 [marine bacterium AO1-C]|nr:hypothetical protein BKI52_37720 [marine bacterium AO1-C]